MERACSRACRVCTCTCTVGGLLATARNKYLGTERGSECERKEQDGVRFRLLFASEFWVGQASSLLCVFSQNFFFGSRDFGVQKNCKRKGE